MAVMDPSREQSRTTCPTPRRQDFSFIVTTSAPSHSESDRQRVRNHARRNRQPRGPSTTRPWDLSDQCHGRRVEKKWDAAFPWIPPRVGSDLSLAWFPEGVNAGPRVVRDATRCIHMIQDIIYPTHLCVVVRPSSGGWFASLWTDVVYFHALLFSAGILADTSRGGLISTPSMKYLSDTIRLLQNRLNESDPKLVASDATIMTVVGLSATAAICGDMDAARNHVSGLFRLVEVRGGLATLTATHPSLIAKVCKADVELALSAGQPPLFPITGVQWEPHIAGRKLMRRIPESLQDQATQRPVLGTSDAKLLSVWADLRELAKLSNLANQTSQKIPAAAFNEMQVSILYRLIFLKEYHSHRDEAGLTWACLLAFAFTIFIQHQNHVMQRFDRVVGHLRAALRTLSDSTLVISESLTLWMLMTLRVAVPTDKPESWEKEVLYAALPDLNIEAWSRVQSLLKEFMWIECLQEELGKKFLIRALSE